MDPEKTGFPVAIIDGGRNYSDGNRILVMESLGMV